MADSKTDLKQTLQKIQKIHRVRIDINKSLCEIQYHSAKFVVKFKPAKFKESNFTKLIEQFKETVHKYKGYALSIFIPEEQIVIKHNHQNAMIKIFVPITNVKKTEKALDWLSKNINLIENLFKHLKMQSENLKKYGLPKRVFKLTCYTRLIIDKRKNKQIVNKDDKIMLHKFM